MTDDEIMKSLDKYRPDTYLDSRIRTGGDDINDLRDYYSGLGTRHRALKRVQLITDARNGGSGGYEPYGRQPYSRWGGGEEEPEVSEHLSFAKKFIYLPMMLTRL